MVGLKTGHIRKNLTKLVNPRDIAGELRRRRKVPLTGITQLFPPTSEGKLNTRGSYCARNMNVWGWSVAWKCCVFCDSRHDTGQPTRSQDLPPQFTTAHEGTPHSAPTIDAPSLPGVRPAALLVCRPPPAALLIRLWSSRYMCLLLCSYVCCFHFSLCSCAFALRLSIVWWVWKDTVRQCTPGVIDRILCHTVCVCIVVLYSIYFLVGVVTWCQSEWMESSLVRTFSVLIARNCFVRYEWHLNFAVIVME